MVELKTNHLDSPGNADVTQGKDMQRQPHRRPWQTECNASQPRKRKDWYGVASLGPRKPREFLKIHIQKCSMKPPPSAATPCQACGTSPRASLASEVGGSSEIRGTATGSPSPEERQAGSSYCKQCGEVLKTVKIKDKILSLNCSVWGSLHHMEAIWGFRLSICIRCGLQSGLFLKLLQ